MRLRMVHVVLLAASGIPAVAAAQAPGREAREGRRQQRTPPSAPGPAALPRVDDPAQRLDPGAWLCATEADLAQHQAAVAARLNGAERAEPSGCRLIRVMTPVTVSDRHGLAHTAVRLAGPPVQQGWTDAVIPGQTSR